jgi:hypothetical protein
MKKGVQTRPVCVFLIKENALSTNASKVLVQHSLQQEHSIPTWCELVTFHMRILPLLPPDTMRHGDRESLSAMARAVTCDTMRSEEMW